MTDVGGYYLYSFCQPRISSRSSWHASDIMYQNQPKITRVLVMY